MVCQMKKIYRKRKWFMKWLFLFFFIFPKKSKIKAQRKLFNRILGYHFELHLRYLRKKKVATNYSKRDLHQKHISYLKIILSRYWQSTPLNDSLNTQKLYFKNKITLISLNLTSEAHQTFCSLYKHNKMFLNLYKKKLFFLIFESLNSDSFEIFIFAL